MVWSSIYYFSILLILWLTNTTQEHKNNANFLLNYDWKYKLKWSQLETLKSLRQPIFNKLMKLVIVDTIR